MIIRATDVVRRYRGRRGQVFDAVRGVSLSVRRGELFALLGTNGAGKTSLMEVLEGLAVPTSGQVQVLGGDPARSRNSIRPRVGIVLQHSGFPPELTVAETASMWAGTLSSPRPVGEALELVDLRQRAGVGVAQLSGGERRRLDLALAVMGRPEVLFLDEPTTGLDPENRRRAWDLIRNLLDGGTTVLLTTHHLQEAEVLADRLAIMHRGRLVRTGTPAEVAQSQPARISFSWPAATLSTAGVPASLPNLPGEVQACPVRGRMVVHTADLQLTLAPKDASVRQRQHDDHGDADQRPDDEYEWCCRAVIIHACPLSPTPTIDVGVWSAAPGFVAAPECSAESVLGFVRSSQ